MYGGGKRLGMPETKLGLNLRVAKDVPGGVMKERGATKQMILWSSQYPPADPRLTSGRGTGFIFSMRQIVNPALPATPLKAASMLSAEKVAAEDIAVKQEAEKKRGGARGGPIFVVKPCLC